MLWEKEAELYRYAPELHGHVPVGVYMHRASQPQLFGVLPRVNRLQQAKVLVIASNYAARSDFLELMGVALTLRT